MFAPTTRAILIANGVGMFCCDHCAEQAGVTELRDRA